MKKKHLWLLVLVLMSAVMLNACSSGGGSGAGANAGGTSRAVLGTSTIVATGGTGTYSGGGSGFMHVQSYNMNGVTLSKYGTVDTTFTVPTYAVTVDLGSNGATVASSATVTVLDYNAADPGAGVLYMVTNGPGNTTYPHLYKGTGTKCCTVGELAYLGRQIVTGLKVEAGATLTLGLNETEYDNYYWTFDSMDMGYNTADVEFTNDVEIFGTVKTADLTTTRDGNIHYRHYTTATARDMGLLYMSASQMFIRSGGSIITKGADGAADTDERGGDGGAIALYASNYFVSEGTIDSSGGNGDGAGDGGFAGVYDNFDDCAWSGGGCLDTDIYFSIYTNGVLINKGPISGNGGNGANGGVSAGAEIEASSYVYNTGAITANGGNGTAGAGGNALVYRGDDTYGSNIGLDSNYASVFNSGALTANGGNGTTSGGDGGSYYDIYLSAGDNSATGNLVNSGDITTNGGSISATGTGNAGDGGGVWLGAYGSIKNSGNFTANGGASLGIDYSGGDGGWFAVDGYAPDVTGSSELGVMQILLSGNVSVKGGTGYSGGDGGEYEVDQWATGTSFTVQDGGIQILGYTSADLSAGNGDSYGGRTRYDVNNDDNDVEIFTSSDHNPSDVNNQGSSSSDKLPAGPVNNEVDITVKGGSAAATGQNGRQGGYIFIASGSGTNYEAFDTLISNVTNSLAKLDVSGGAGGSGSSAGNGGGIEMLARGGSVTNSGALDLPGGNATAGFGGVGGIGGVYLTAGVNVMNTAAILATGGTGSYGGNDGGGNTVIDLYAGGLATNSGNITANGGNGAYTTGSGAEVSITSESGESTNTGAISVAAGVDTSALGDATVGTSGSIWLDGVDVTP